MAKQGRKTQKPQRASFGPVSRINTAPVAVGNSVRGTKPRVTQTANGARIVGRDFAFALTGTVAAATDWEVIGGMPITPCALPNSVLKSYCQMFANFKVNSITAHYITSSPTSQAGDVMFYYEQKRTNPFPDYTSSAFLPYVLSDPNTVIGPQWTNHTAVLNPLKDWKSTAYGNCTDIDEEAAGSLYMFSKTNSANSPGYVILDYDISFKNLALNPRVGVLPVARAQCTPVALTIPSGGTTAGSAAQFTINTGKTVGGATSLEPTGGLVGDIYKCIFQMTNSVVTGTNTWTVTTGGPATFTNILQYKDDTAVSLDDGSTFYLRREGTNTWQLYSTIDAARTDSNTLEWQTAFSGATVSVSIAATISLVTNVDDFQQSSYSG